MYLYEWVCEGLEIYQILRIMFISFFLVQEYLVEVRYAVNGDVDVDVYR